MESQMESPITLRDDNIDFSEWQRIEGKYNVHKNVGYSQVLYRIIKFQISI
jgi:hypothetical protein